MGWYASGNGCVKAINVDAFYELEDKLSERNSEIQLCDSTESKLEISIMSEGNYHGDDIFELLTEIQDKVTEGYIVYNGEDGTTWRFILKDGSWVEENGEVYYCYEDMIKILEANGYAVTKKGE